MTTTGWEASTDDGLMAAVAGFRAGFESLVNLDPETVFKARGEKEAAPATMFLVTRELLGNAEAEMLKRDLDPATVAGRDWIAVFNEIEATG